MQRRVIAAVVAVLLAGIGAVLLYSYVSSADRRAMANQEPVDVLIVTKAIPAGTPAELIAPYLQLKQLPRAAVVPGALTSPADPAVAGLVTSTGLEVGEQVMRTRFIQPGLTATGEVAVPSDMQSLTIQLDPMRAVGTTIVPGDKLGIFISKEVAKVERTRLVLRDVLVTRVQGAPDPTAEAAKEGAPSDQVILTIALTPEDATKVVWASEYGEIWLALEPKEGDHEITPTITVKQVF